MAINTVEISQLGQKFPLDLVNAVRELGNSSDPSTSSKRSRYKNKKKKSPYLHNENVQMMSRVSEKRFVQKKNEVFSSFPLAANIYKASSAEFKAIKKSKKGKKLCVPNTPDLKACTVSDMSNSEYFDHKCSEKEKVKKRMPNQIRKYQRKPKTFQIFDRDARFELNCSSSDLVGKKHGDGQVRKGAEYEDFAAQDVWTVLRNINQFQFNRIQQLSDDSIHSPRKKRNMYKPPKLNWPETQTAKRTFKNVRKGRRLIETVRTEEMTYVANIEIEEQAASKTSVSQSSSFDRVTVINKNDVKSQDTKQENNRTVQRIRPRNMPLTRLPPADRNNRRKAPKPLPLTERPVSATSDQKARLKTVPSSTPPKSRFLRDNLTKSYSTPPKPLNAREKNYNSLIVRVPLDEKCHNKLMASKQKSADVISLTGSQDSSKCLRDENEFVSKFYQKNKLFHPNEMKEFVKKGFLYNTHQMQNTGAPMRERRTKTIPTRMTLGEIKRKMAQIKFPFTILNKDELTSAMIEVIDMDPPQYYGLDKHMWPFMVGWERDNDTNPENKLLDNIEQFASNSHKLKEDIIKSRHGDGPKKRMERDEMGRDEMKFAPAPPRVVSKKLKTKRQLRDKMMTIWQKNAPPLAENIDVEKEEKNKKLNINIQQMLRATESTHDMPKKTDSIEILHKGPIKTLERGRMPLVIKQFPWSKGRRASDFIDNVISKLKKGAYYSHEKRRSSSGDIAYPLSIADGDKLDHKHASMQTLTLDDVASEKCESDVYDQLNPDCNLSESDSYVTIPGFDESLPELEIQSLGFNQIAVKHCLTNVTVQFDVAVPSSTSSSGTSSCCVPLSAGNTSQTKVYKCSTTIWNAALPAELCTVLPTLMKSMFDLSSSLSDISEGNILSLTNSDTFAENALGNHNHWMNHYNSSYPQNLMILPALEQPPRRSHRYGAGTHVPWFVSNAIPVCPPFIICPQLIEIMKGRYSRKGRKLRKKSLIETRFELLRKDKVINQTKLLLRKDKFSLLENDQPRLLVQVLMYVVVDPRQFIMPKANSVLIDDPTVSDTRVERRAIASHCTALQVYKSKETERIDSEIPFFDFRNLLKDMWIYCRFNIHFDLPQYLDAKQLVDSRCNIFERNVKIGNETSMLITKLSMPSNDYGKGLVTISNAKQLGLVNISNSKQLSLVNISNAKELTPLNSNYNCHEKMWVERVSKVKEQIKIFNQKAKALLTESRTPVQRTMKILTESRTPIQSTMKTSVQVGVPKLNEKCKSSEGMTSLDKIQTMDDFIEALGSARHLASVFDGLSEIKLMLCVGEMKNWIGCITSRQALLVLLLTTKKDTSNLMRLRPLVLQGIAMNRITRVSELDLEIEVLEKENFNVSQYEGSAAAAAQVQPTAPIINRKDLLEELCWIAKNTASDYQRPFDESSERFLNTLLKKRNNLHPSYLRVMARYVGLGLLQTNG